MTCGRTLNAFLCNLEEEKSSPWLLRPCVTEEQQVCLNTETGKTALCVDRKSEFNVQERSQKNAKFWMNFWSEWHQGNGITNPHQDIKKLCVTKHKNVEECHIYGSTRRACITAKNSYLENCMELVDNEMGIPICIEVRFVLFSLSSDHFVWFCFRLSNIYRFPYVNANQCYIPKEMTSIYESILMHSQ